MNHPTPPNPANPPEAIDARAIDRLVDGELSEKERHALLASLDSEGWKRCALAFLEAQSWREALSAGVGCAGLRLGGPVEPAKPQAAWWPRPARRFGAAAVVAIVFALGAIAGSRWPGAQPTAPVITAGAPAQPPADPDSAPRADASHVLTRAVDVPLLPATSVNADAVLTADTGISPYLLAQLQRQGYEVKRDRKLVSVALDDGRKVTIPVDTIRWQFVGLATH